MNILIIGNKYTGKTVLEKELQQTYNFKKIVSYTTRKPRPTEVNNIDYHFITENEFVELSMSNFFIESVNNYGNWYGIAKKDLLDEENNVLVVDRKGLKQILGKSNRDNYFIVKLECDFGEQVFRLLDRFDLDDMYSAPTNKKYNDLIKQIETLKEDNINLSQEFEYDITLDTQTIGIKEEAHNIMLYLSNYSTNHHNNNMAKSEIITENGANNDKQ